MFTPTKQQLEELGFKEYKFSKNWQYYFGGDNSLIYRPSEGYRKNLPVRWTVSKDNCYPESIEDIQTLIRLLSPTH